MPIDLASHDCEAQALSRLPAYMNKQRWRELLEVVASEIQEVDDATVAVSLQLGLYEAADEMLDLFGADLGVPRAGLEDDDYRVRILAKIAVLRSLGLVKDLNRAARLILNDDESTIRVLPTPPAALSLVIGGTVGTPTELADVLVDAARAAVSGGVRVVVESSTEPDADTFSFFDGPGKGFAGTPPTLDLGPLLAGGSGYDAVIGFRGFGAEHDGTHTLTFVEDAGAAPGGALDESDPTAIVFTFQGGVTDSDDFEFNVAGSTYLFIDTPNTAGTVTLDPTDDEFGPEPFEGAGGDGGVFATARI